ncbi:MAG: Galactose/methyl galactoside import ATP-binding protein MglA [Deltaproteobacteria bacterium]|jgi:simple sugar transport system ATP-binding protein|nr:Galactose/methyl galactoside import ATP-binding protein MglA [Deltaproteobacteria bacterium]
MGSAEKEQAGKHQNLTLELKGITKYFPGIVANDNVDFNLREGEIHTILGENGAGKSTLMNIIAGLYPADEGEIKVFGETVNFTNPRQAIEKSIGMVFQHFMLVRNHTVAENIILGLPGVVTLELKKVHQQIREISDRYDLFVDPEKKIQELSVGEQQRVEIVKVLFRGARILILDEPTAVLTPQESGALYDIMQRMADEKHSIIFITHKMKEVMALSHRITVLSRGKVMATLRKEETNPEALAELMIGNPETKESEIVEELLKETEIDHQDKHSTYTAVKSKKSGKLTVALKDIHAVNDLGRPALKGISLEIHSGEILGMAGVSGNGQPELADVLSGMRSPTQGSYQFEDVPLDNPTVNEMIGRGVGYIPEDRNRYGVSSGMSIAYNFLLRDYKNPKFSKNQLLKSQNIFGYGSKKIKEFDIRAPSEKTPVGLLSGGNMQKVILAREISRPLRLLLASQPTRGLDIHATSFIREQICQARDKGLAVLWISEDLDELLMVADRIAVMFEGRIVGILTKEEASISLIGQMMTGMDNNNSENFTQSKEYA